MVLALALNGFQLIANDEDAVMAMLQLASGEIGEEGFATWVRSNRVSAPDVEG